jgi:phosphopantothenoylcysteine decarboxylase/phosphopantothenate--cysteine ligase
MARPAARSILRRPRRRASLLLALNFVNYAVCVLAWLAVLLLDTESVELSGPIIFLLGLVVLVGGARAYLVAAHMGLCYMSLVLLLIALVNIFTWSPDEARGPFLLIGGLFLFSMPVWLFLASSRLPIESHLHCQKCGYLLVGLSSPRCPECGTPFNADVVRRELLEHRDNPEPALAEALARMQRKLLITAGPTREPIDAVRYVANRSSGRLGVALAVAAREAGWDVTLLLGPTEVAAPQGIQVHRFESCRDLEALLAEHFARCDVLIMAAAVADYRPVTTTGDKLARLDQPLTLQLEPTPDLVAQCVARKQPDQRIIGFALEHPNQLATRAQQKLQRKGLDAIIANPLQTMGATDINATIYTAAGESHAPGQLSKTAFATWLLNWLDQQPTPPK